MVARTSMFPEIVAPETLCHVKLFAGGVALGIEPRLVIETRRRRQPGCRRPTARSSIRATTGSVVAKLAAIHEDLAEETQLLIEDHDHRRRLNDLEWKHAICVDAGHAVWKTVSERIVHVVSSRAASELPSPRGENNTSGLSPAARSHKKV